MDSPSEPIRVLHVDDEPDFADMAGEFIRREDERFDVETAMSVSEALNRLQSNNVDCIVSDFDMPGQNGIDFLESLRQEYPDLPFILFTGKGSEEVASEAITKGVSDYLQKESGRDQYRILANRIVNLVSQYRAESSIQVKARQQQIIAELGRDALADTELETLFERAVDAVADALDADYAKILEYHPERGVLFLRAGVGWKEGTVGNATVSDELDSQAGFTLQSEQPVVVEDLSTEDRFSGPKLLTDHDVVSGISVIIGDANDPWGVLGTHTTERQSFSSDEVAFVQNIANVLASAINRRARESALEREHDRFLTLFENLPSPVVHSEVHGNEPVIKRVNQAFEDTFGYTHEEAAGRTIDELIVPEERRKEGGQSINECLFEEGQLTTEVRRQTPDGQREFILNGVLSEQNGTDESYTVYTDIMDLKVREQELREAERRFQAMFDDPNILVGLIDTDGTVLDINETAMDYIDDELEDVIGEPFWETSWFAGDESIQSDVQEWIRQAADGEYVAFEIDLTESVGKPLVVSGVFRPVTDDDGEVQSLLISDRDITKQKHREWELQQERDRFRSVFEKATDAMVIADDNGRYLDANPAAAELFGLNQEELIGRSIVEFAPDDFDFEAAWEKFRQSDRERGTFPLVRADGEQRTVEYAASAEIVEGQHLSVLRDITDRQDREEQLKQSTARLEALYENSPDMIDVLDTSGQLLDVNSRFCQELDYTEEELLGRPIWEIDVDVTEEDVQSLLTDFEMDERRKFEGTYKRKDGSTFPVEVHLLRLNIAGADRFLAISRDISERKAYERSLERQNERLDEFAGLVSHDLRNPLNVAEGRLELLREDCTSEHLDSIEGALDRMDTLIENMLELARLGQQVSDIESVDLVELADSCWENVDTGDATLVSADAPTIQADRSRVQQLLENLIRNAVEHGGGGVTITIGEIDDGIYVEDDGIGISENVRDQIFESGYSTSGEGTGFGLSIVQQIAEAHGWTVKLVTGTDTGARFEFSGVRTK